MLCYYQPQLAQRIGQVSALSRLDCARPPSWCFDTCCTLGHSLYFLIRHICRTSWRGQTRVGLLLKIIVPLDRLYAYTSSEMSDIILHASKTNAKSTLLFCFFVFFALKTFNFYKSIQCSNKEKLESKKISLPFFLKDCCALKNKISKWEVSRFGGGFQLIRLLFILCQPVCPKFWHVMAHMKGRRIKLTSIIVAIQIWNHEW